MKKLFISFVLCSSWCMATDNALVPAVPKKKFYADSSWFDSSSDRQRKEASALLANLIDEGASVDVLQDVAKKADVNSRVWFNSVVARTLLRVAIEKQHEEAVRILLHAKADPDGSVSAHCYALEYVVCDQPNIAIVKHLLDYKASVDRALYRIKPFYYLAVHAPADENSFEIVRMLLDARAEIFYGFADFYGCGGFESATHCTSNWCRYLAIIQHPMASHDRHKASSKYNCKSSLSHQLTARDQAFQDVISAHRALRQREKLKECNARELEKIEENRKKREETQPQQTASRIKGMDLVRLAADMKARQPKAPGEVELHFCWECAPYGSPGHPIVPSSSHD